MFMMHTSGGVPIRCLFFLPYLACDLRALHRGTQTQTPNTYTKRERIGRLESVELEGVRPNTKACAVGSVGASAVRGRTTMHSEVLGRMTPCMTY